MNKFIRFFAIILIFGSWVAESHAGSSAGLITELTGAAWIHRNDQKLEAVVGQSLMPKDTLELAKGSRMNLLTFPACDEWVLPGPDKIRIETDSPPISKAHPNVRPVGTFDICFDPGSFMTASHGRLGGIAVRSDLVRKQRLKADNHTATAAELLTVVLFDLKAGRTEKAEPYYDMLMEKVPSGSIPETLSDYFQKSP